MNLNNFEHEIDEVIVHRGLDYYYGGHVESMEVENGECVAEVSGSEYYWVTGATEAKKIVSEFFGTL